MTNQPNPREDRLWELLADRALFGLEVDEAAELQALLAEHPEIDPDTLDLLAAQHDVATWEGGAAGVDTNGLPAAARERARQAARGSEDNPGTSARVKSASVKSANSRAGALRPREALAWAAAAACLLAALGVWLMGRPAPPPSLAEQRQQLARADDALRLEWTATADAAAQGASGDVLWSTSRQQGFMRFRGLAVNDPRQNQYQLWIFDTNQDEKYPIDGGVFNVDAATGEVIVPIQAKLRVTAPTLFAITVEKPGGVVVSSRQRLPLLAPVAPKQG